MFNKTNRSNATNLQPAVMFIAGKQSATKETRITVHTMFYREKVHNRLHSQALKSPSIYLTKVCKLQLTMLLMPVF
jgi:hypothetical protein